MSQEPPLSEATIDSDLSPAAPWAIGMRRRGGLMQVAFAGVSLVLGSLAIGGQVRDVLIVAFGVAVFCVFAYAIRAVSGTSGRPITSEAKRIKRAVTRATIVTLVASSALVTSSIATAHSDWALPSVAIVNGGLLLWLDRRFDIPRNRLAGWALIVGAFILAATMSGSALVATTGIAAGALLLGIAVGGLHELAAVHALPKPAHARGTP